MNELENSRSKIKTDAMLLSDYNFTFILGDMIGQYEVLAQLGYSHMGEVYHVRHAILELEYALRILPEDFPRTPETLSRFKAEAKIIASLNHTNIVKVDDFGDTTIHYWLRMELMGTPNDLTSLNDLAENNGGKIDQLLLAKIINQTLSGLQYAHQHGVIHRDLKPTNILLSGTENDLITKVAGFGLVKLATEEFIHSQADHTTPPRAIKTVESITNRWLGTDTYMSPEQKRGETLDLRSDLYSMGLIILRLLTGKPELDFAVPSHIDPELIVSWDKLIQQSLYVNLDQRISSAAEMQALIIDIIEKLEMIKVEHAQLTAEQQAKIAHQDEAKVLSLLADIKSLKVKKESRQQALRDEANLEAKRIVNKSIRKNNLIKKIIIFIIMPLLFFIEVWAVILYFNKTNTEKQHKQILSNQIKTPKKTITQKESPTLIKQKDDTFIIEHAKQNIKPLPQNKSITPKHSPPKYNKSWKIPNMSMKLIFISPGSLKVNSNVKLSNNKSFWISKYEISQKNYHFIMDSTTDKNGKKPVVNVTWNNAVEFCKKLTINERKTGRITLNYKYRLPTEKEWEFAARGGRKSHGYKYSGSDNIDKVAWYLDNACWFSTSYLGYSHNPGKKAPNELGIYDMSGNVYEWCSNIWHSKSNKKTSNTQSLTYETRSRNIRINSTVSRSRFSSSLSRSNFSSSQSGSNNSKYTTRVTSRVIRGGSWSDKSANCQVDRRFGGSQDLSNEYLGFRIVMSRK